MVEQCLIDLYFDESNTPLPWATDTKSQWLPWYSSMRWLRPLDPKERPHGMLAIEPTGGNIRNETLHGQVVPFADPVTKRQAIFASNAWSSGGEEGVSGTMPLIGYTREFYKGISVVSLQFGCKTVAPGKINIRLDAKKSGAYDTPIARFNKLDFPAGFVSQLNELQKANSDRNTIFYRNLFAPPLGTKGTSDTSSSSAIKP